MVKVAIEREADTRDLDEKRVESRDGNGSGLDRVHQDLDPDSFFRPGSKFDPNLQGL